MKRSDLLSRLENSMLMLGKGMHEEQLGFSGCSPAQNHVLLVVGMHGDIGVKQLAEMLRVTSGAATQHVDALEKAGLLERTMSSNDRRGVIVTVTEKGKNAYQAIRRAKSRILNEVFEALSDEELATLVKLIEKVSHQYLHNTKEAHAEI